MTLRILVTSALLLGPAVAWASSDEAWAAFRKDVAAKCLAQARKAGMTAPQITVDPIGTESYGVAVLVTGGDQRYCIYDKRKKTAELTSQK